MRARAVLIQAFAGLGLPLLLAACGSSTGPTDPYANGQTHPWEETRPAVIGAQSLTPGVNTLQFERVLFAKNAWGPVERNTSNGEQKAGDGHPISLNEQTYPQGYGVHANSELRFSLAGADGAQCSLFSTFVGVDDEVGRRGSVVFQVFVDGVLQASSGVMRGGAPAQALSANIAGKKELRLVVTDAGDGLSYDHADWADPRIYCGANTPVSLTLDRGELSVFHKHSASLTATFAAKGAVAGPLNLRLERADPNRGLLLELRTPQVNFTGPGSATRTLTIAAPFLSSNYDPRELSAPYRLTASAGGRDVASAVLTITVKPMQVSARIVPGRLSGHDGDLRSATVEVTVNPPLEEPVNIDLAFAPNLTQEANTPIAAIANVGATRAEGGVLRADAQFRFSDGLPVPYPDEYLTSDEVLYVLVNDASGEPLFGYRRPSYGNLAAPITLQLLR